MKHLLILTLIVLLFLAAACGPSPGYEDTKDIGNMITRWQDNEAGVVCWVFVAYNKGGISCLPVSETKLDR